MDKEPTFADITVESLGYEVRLGPAKSTTKRPDNCLNCKKIRKTWSRYKYRYFCSMWCGYSYAVERIDAVVKQAGERPND